MINNTNLIFGGGKIAESISIINNAEIVYYRNEKDIKEYLKKFDKLNEVYITSGYLKRIDFFNQTNEDIQHTIDANLIFPIMVAKLLEKFIKSGTKIIFISSSSSFDTRSGYSIYASTKTALEIFAKTLFNEGMQNNENYDIRIIRPARTDTKLRWNNLDKNNSSNWENLLKPNEIALEIKEFLNTSYNYLYIYKNNEKIITEVKKW